MTSSFQTIDSEASNLPGESISSILVLNTTDISSSSGSNSTPTVVENLDQKFQNMKWIYEECLKDNILLKSQCDYLNSKLEDLRKSDNTLDAEYETFNGNESILAYVDVDNICVSTKIEQYIKETNEMFTNKEALCDSMAFLVKNVWSLIAHKYSDTSLEDSQLIKDQLLDKLINTKEDSPRQQQEKLFSLNDELNSFANNTDAIKNKITEQNETMKSIISQLKVLKPQSIVIKDSSKSASIEPTISPNTEQRNLITDDESFSPGTSPSSFFLNRFDNKLANRTTQQDKEYKDSKLTPGKLMTNDFYIFNHGEYIAIDKTIENSNAMIKSQTEEELSADLFTCPMCKTSVTLDKIKKHSRDLHLRGDCTEKSVCMFCMDLFDKNLQEEFEIHVRSHLSLNINDT